jgi:hypothetical protein
MYNCLPVVTSVRFFGTKLFNLVLSYIICRCMVKNFMYVKLPCPVLNWYLDKVIWPYSLQKVYVLIIQT